MAENKINKKEGCENSPLFISITFAVIKRGATPKTVGHYIPNVLSQSDRITDKC